MPTIFRLCVTTTKLHVGMGDRTNDPVPAGLTEAIIIDGLYFSNMDGCVRRLVVMYRLVTVNHCGHITDNNSVINV